MVARMSSPRTEFQRIADFVKRFPKAKVPVGIGDDCAVLRPRANTELCITTDALVEDVHFTRAGFRPEDVGHKALAVNLSDLASMGAVPAWFVCAMELPAWVDDAVLAGIARGMSALAKKAGIALVGGNLSRSEKLSVTLTLAGEVPRGKALLRSGARPGDVLYVSGTLGDARLGYVLLSHPRHRSHEPRPSMPVRRQRRPEPRLELGLMARAWATAAVDISDGLAQDLGHLCEASKVGARVELERLPVSRALRLHAGVEAPLWAARGGEDYELLLTVPKGRAARFEKACERAEQRVTRIGETTRRRKVTLLGAEGRELTGIGGFDHFAG
jgi:thiamine-monophosphate kinase